MTDLSIDLTALRDASTQLASAARSLTPDSTSPAPRVWVVGSASVTDALNRCAAQNEDRLATLAAATRSLSEAPRHAADRFEETDRTLARTR
jgi:hypothetical protein